MPAPISLARSPANQGAVGKEGAFRKGHSYEESNWHLGGASLLIRESPRTLQRPLPRCLLTRQLTA